jgi:hypothetical protein
MILASCLACGSETIEWFHLSVHQNPIRPMLRETCDRFPIRHGIPGLNRVR